MATLEEALTRAAARSVPLPALLMRRALREAANLTQRDVATVLGVDRASVARWELGSREPRGELRQAYADLLRSLDQAHSLDR